MNDNNFIFIGIDPGSLKLGFAVVELIGGKIKLKRSGVIVFSKIDSLQKKLLYIFDYFKNMVLLYLKEGFTVIFSVERPFCFKNPQSAFILVSVYSIFLLLAEQCDVELISMTPCSIKKLFRGAAPVVKRT